MLILYKVWIGRLLVADLSVPPLLLHKLIIIPKQQLRTNRHRGDNLLTLLLPLTVRAHIPRIVRKVITELRFCSMVIHFVK